MGRKLSPLVKAYRWYDASSRRDARERSRQERETAKRFQEQQKHQTIQEAKTRVALWKKYVEVIQSMHKDCTAPVDWQEILDTPEPELPQYCDQHERLAQERLRSFKPSFLDSVIFDALFSSSAKKRKKLESRLVEARDKDAQIHSQKIDEYCVNEEEWLELHEMAKGVLNKDIRHYKNVLEYFDPFSSIGALGSEFRMSFKKTYVDFDLYVNGEDVLPAHILNLTSTNKLSQKEWSKTAFNELYQDHVCSAVLRVARELFNYLPVEFVRINALAKLRNSKTGYLENQPILSVLIPGEVLNGINLNEIDPSDSMDNFDYCMNFKKSAGFSAVEKVELPG